MLSALHSFDVAGIAGTLGGPLVHFVALLALCAAYLQGGLVKLFDFRGASDEMRQFGLAPAPLFAALVIVLELGASLLVLTGWLRWFGALALGAFTLSASWMALRFWRMPAGQARAAAANAFFEHVGLAGGFVLVAWLDLR